jgi:hypothetical protein
MSKRERQNFLQLSSHQKQTTSMIEETWNKKSLQTHQRRTHKGFAYISHHPPTALWPSTQTSYQRRKSRNLDHKPKHEGKLCNFVMSNFNYSNIDTSQRKNSVYLDPFPLIPSVYPFHTLSPALSFHLYSFTIRHFSLFVTHIRSTSESCLMVEIFLKVPWC